MHASTAPATRPVGDLLRWGRSLLTLSDTPALDAELLLAHALCRNRVWVLAHADCPCSEPEVAAYEELIAQRREGMPVAYLRGYVEWFDMRLETSPGVLIPRPETELLLERAIELARQHSYRSAVDVGTGSGALAIGLARHVPALRVQAIDVSLDALRLARRNAASYRVADRVCFVQGSLLDPLDHEPDILMANLPYLSGEFMRTLPCDVRREPATALYGGPTGLELYRDLLHQLSQRGWNTPLFIEIDPGQADSLPGLLKVFSARPMLELMSDYSGRPRIAVIRPQTA